MYKKVKVKVAGANGYFGIGGAKSLQPEKIFLSNCFRYASPSLWNELPNSFRQPSPDHCSSPHVIRTVSHSVTLLLSTQNLSLLQILSTSDSWHPPDFLLNNAQRLFVLVPFSSFLFLIFGCKYGRSWFPEFTLI